MKNIPASSENSEKQGFYMTENLGTIALDPVRRVWLWSALDCWQAANMVNATRVLHNWTKKYCALKAPEAPDESEGKSEVEAEEVDEE